MAEPGPAVDIHGEPVIDPTKNVLDTLNAAIRRIDDIGDLRAEHMLGIAALRAEYENKIAGVRTEYEELLRQAERRAHDSLRDAEIKRIDMLVQKVNEVAGSAAEELQRVKLGLETRLAAVEKLIWEGAGKERVSEPLESAERAALRDLISAVAAREGRGSGMHTLWGIIAVAAGVAIAAISLVHALTATG